MERKKTSVTPYIIIIAIVVVIALILSTILYSENQRANNGERALEITYTRALNELASYVTNISNTLEKAQYVGTAPQMQELSANLWRDSSAAKASLTTIPTGEIDLTSINKYLSQTGNYMISLAKKLEEGQKLSDDEYKTIVDLQENAESLKTHIYSISDDIANGKLKVSQFYEGDSENKSGGGDDTNPKNANALKSQVVEMEEGLKSFPSLIYDGPFSDHIISRTPSLTEDKVEITVEQAKVAAAGAAQVSIDKIQYTQDEKSNMPSYCFNAGDTAVTVTKNGGYIAYMLKSREIGDKKISTDTAYNNAVKYLSNLGIKSLESKYFEIINGICTFNFAYNLDGITCYTDLIKIGVAMDNGDILSFDARGYIMNHKTREIVQPKITPEKARESVSRKLEILEVNRAIIPTTGKNEIATYEFKTKSEKGDNVLVYVNDQTGEEEQILILIINEDGALTV
ncbi:MAG: germination protein YpeB [Oscillospiraceae bacterium]